MPMKIKTKKKIIEKTLEKTPLTKTKNKNIFTMTFLTKINLSTKEAILKH